MSLTFTFLPSEALAMPIRNSLKSVLAASAMVIAGCLGTALASSLTVQFPSPSSAVVDSNGLLTGADYCCFFNAGDNITQTFAGTGLGSVNMLSLALPVSYANLGAGAQVDFNVLLNGTVLGSFAWTSAQGTGTENFNASFAPIVGVGGSYTAELLETNSVPSGQGSIGFNYGSLTLSDVSTVPEPGSLALLIVGLAGLGGFAGLRKLRRRNTAA